MAHRRVIYGLSTSRRGLLGTGLLAPALALPAAPAKAASFSRVIDLTQLIVATPAAAAGGRAPSFAMEPVRSYDKDKMNINRWTVVEHSGTHIDAPLHFSANGPSLDTIAVSDLVVPLALIDISRRAQDDPETAVTPDDVRAWERAHGPLPDGCCVVMNSGWSAYFGTPRANGRGADGKSHVPGFHLETAQMLMRERRVKGIGVDTSSLDQGSLAGAYPVHNAWLPSGRWGLENLANLDQVPPSGATLVVGAMKVKGATGGPARVIALI